MVARIFISGALIILAAGFLWFAGNVIYLGVKEFFKPKDAKPTRTATSSPAPTTAPTAP